MNGILCCRPYFTVSFLEMLPKKPDGSFPCYLRGSGIAGVCSVRLKEPMTGVRVDEKLGHSAYLFETLLEFLERRIRNPVILFCKVTQEGSPTTGVISRPCAIERHGCSNRQLGPLR